MAKSSQSQDPVDRRVELSLYRIASRVQINVMEIPRICAVGREAASAGCTDAELDDAMSAFLDKIRIK